MLFLFLTFYLIVLVLFSGAKIHIYFHISDFYFSDDIMHGIVVPFCLTKAWNILDALMFSNGVSIFYLLSTCNLCYVLVKSEIFIQRIGDFFRQI